MDLLTAAQPGKAARRDELREHGFPAYTTSAGWLGYSDAKVARLVGEALDDGFTHVKLKVGADIDDDVRRCAMVRELVGPDVLIGLSTHARAEIDAREAQMADYIAVGPVHETPTKPGRPAVGLDLVRYAAARAPRPFFAIGGLDAGNLSEALDAGARRAVVLRAIAGAEDPERAARELRAQIDARPLGR